ncbi:hypothetical protein SLE2022_037930 [Rubroshorea leprosula]
MPAMAGMGFNQKNDSRESDGILGKRNEKGEFSASVLNSLGIQRGEEGAASISDNGCRRFDFDLNEPPGLEEDGIGIGFVDDVDSLSRFCEQETENRQSSSLLFGVNLKRIADDEEARSPRKRKRFSYEEKGKAKAVDDDQLLLGIDDGDLNLNLGLGSKAFYTWPSLSIPENNLGPEEELVDNIRESELRRRSSTENNLGPEEELLNSLGVSEPRRGSIAENNRGPEDELVTSLRESELRRRQEEAIRQHDNAKDYAQRYHESQRLESAKQNETGVMQDQLAEDFESPFGMAMEMIKKRNSRSGNKRNVGDALEPGFKWVPTGSKCHGTAVRCAPSLIDLSLSVLAKNSEAIESLEHVPEALRHKLSEMVCDNRKMDAKFLELLARGSPSEIRAKSCSQITDEEFSQIFGSFDTKNLIVLQLDNCGPFMHDYVLLDTLAQSSRKLPALATISLSGAYRLSDDGLKALAESAPALKSINLSQCSLLTSAGINTLARCFESTLRELYLDECQNIDAMAILPALKKLKCLEVLSVADIPSVCDDFVIGIVEACGKNMKELVFASCVKLTDMSLKSVGETCLKLSAIDLSNLYCLTDSTMRYLANGCQSIHKLKLCRNSFSDEAIAAFLEVSGGALSELSLNNVKRVGLNTASSLAKCSRKLCSLDLSFCRKITDEALGLIVDSCLSLRLLKIFGCTEVTNFFLNVHSNHPVQIIGLKNTPLLTHSNEEPQETPLRYSPLTVSADR